MISIHLIWISIIIPFLATDPDIKKLFNQLPSNPETLIFNNELPINNEGGHLQGVQPYNFKGEQYLFLSGSSSSYGYLAVAHDKQVKRLHQLMFKPFKHAGGFQINGSWLAVGVEDNEARTTSIVRIYKLGDPLSDLKEPVAVIERSGERERATAGAVAIHQTKNTLWVVVGDWGNKHMDFYKADIPSNGTSIRFHKTGEVDMTTHSRSGWIDSVARPFQNINLIQYNDQLYLVGLASEQSPNANVVDVFTVNNLASRNPELTKIYTRKFDPLPNTGFRWAAGVSYHAPDKLSLFTCGENIKSTLTVSVYR